MTVKELYDKLGKLIDYGHANTRVIANCSIKLPWDCKKGDYVSDLPFLYLNDVYYQSGDIELGFSFDKESE